MDPSNMAENEQPQGVINETAKTQEQTPDLDNRFPQQVQEFSNGNVSFRDLTPEKFREGGDTPIVMMVGWAMNQEVVGNTTKGLFDKGQRVIPLDISGGAKGIPGRFEDEIHRQGKTLYEWVKSHPEQKFKFAPQSMSALVVLSMIENHPDIADQIDGVVLLSPMGLAGDAREHTAKASKPSVKIVETDGKVVAERMQQQDLSETSRRRFGGGLMESLKNRVPGKGLFNLLQRKGAEDARNNDRTKTDEDAQIEAKVMKSFTRALSHHPIKSAREGFAMARADEYNVLNLLKAKGIKVGILQGADDNLNSSQGLVENISRQAVAGAAVRSEYVDERGLEKIPDELKIQDTDSQEVVQEKQRKIVALKLDLQKKENRVPIDSLVIVAGGHEITGPYGFSDDILHAFDFLDHPERYRKMLDENLKRNREVEQIKQAEKEELAKTRNELTKEASGTANNTPQNPLQ